MPDHERSELIGADQGPQSDEFLPIWGWWLLALGIAVVSTASFWFARIFYYYAQENPSGIMGRMKGDPPVPFESTQDKVWLFAAGAAVGLLVLVVAYAIRASHRRSQDGWTSAAKRSMAAAVFLLVGAAASLTTFLVLFTRSPVEPDSALEVGGTSTQIITATVAPTTTTVSSTAIPSTVAPTTPSTTTTAPTATTTTATVPGTSTTADVSYSIATHGLHPYPPLPGSGGWFGSGCSPGSDTLPDGIWWGYITDLSPSSVTFDLACLRWFDPPDDGWEGDGGWAIENDNPRIRIVPIHPQAQAICLLWDCPPTPFPYTDWIEMAPVMPDTPDAGVWLYINDGEVTEVGEEVLAG